jgi:hypothetical protein
MIYALSVFLLFLRNGTKNENNNKINSYHYWVHLIRPNTKYQIPEIAKSVTHNLLIWYLVPEIWEN